MAKGYEVLEMLLPNGGWAITGDDYEGIQFFEATPITEKEFNDGFAKLDKFKESQALEKANLRALILERLGITEDEAKLLLG